MYLQNTEKKLPSDNRIESCFRGARGDAILMAQSICLTSAKLDTKAKLKRECGIKENVDQCFFLLLDLKCSFLFS